MSQLENFRLKVFRSVAEHLSFRKAAEHLLLTQPAITQQIQALEAELGVRLFDRSATGVALTPQGSILLRHANRLAALAAKAEQDLGGMDGQVSGELSLGVSTTIAQYVLPRLLGAFLAEHPRVQLGIESGNTEDVVELLLANRIAIGLIEGPARQRGIRTEPFMSDELVLIVPPHFEDAPMSPRQFLHSTLLMRERGSGSRHVVETALRKAGFKTSQFQRVINLDSTETLKSAVEAGLGIGFVSRWAIAKEVELRTLKTATAPGLTIRRHFSLITRTGPEQQGPTDAFRLFALAKGRLLSAPGGGPFWR